LLVGSAVVPVAPLLLLLLYPVSCHLQLQLAVAPLLRAAQLQERHSSAPLTELRAGQLPVRQWQHGECLCSQCG